MFIMTEEERELLKRSVVLSEENNDMLRSIRRSMRFSRLMTIAYWVLIIGVSVGAYYYVEPYLQGVLDAYGGAKTNIDRFGNLFDSLKQ